jgi:hypothetical protein
VDREKLLKAIYKCIEDRDKEVLGEGSLMSIVRRLRSEAHLDEAVMPVIEVPANPVADLLEASLSSSEYIEKAEKIFSVRKSTVPAGIKKYRIGEGRNSETLVPVKASVPGGFDAKAEKALDAYVSHWNNQQSLRGEPYRITWGPHPLGVDLVGFNLELK